MELLRYLPILFISQLSFAVTPALPLVNEKCPFSQNPVDPSQTLSYGVCCGNCLKKASSNLVEFLKKAKPNNKTCPFSAKPVRKTIHIGFCCSKCKKKASS
jgi:bacterioferritin-associated ferredoxin